jgi:pSer/pThr/pTyr-binding forkhead associated (FHA) protein
MSFKRKKAELRSTAYLYLEGNPKPIPLFDKFQFGRMESFDNPAVSRTHFTIKANEHGVYFIIDHESRAGTRVNSQQIKPGEWHELDEGFIILVGPYKFEFSFKPAHKHPNAKVPHINKAEVENKKTFMRSTESAQRQVSKKVFNEEPFSVDKVDSSGLFLDKLPRVSSPVPQRPRRELQHEKVRAKDDYSSRLRLFLIICVVITVLTVVVVQNRKISSRDQMLPYYKGYTNVMKQYFMNYEKYQKKEKEISTYERDQNALVKQLKELESDLRNERSVDRKADYYKKHILLLVGKSVSHSINSQKYFRYYQSNYYSLAKQDHADISYEMSLMNTAFGLRSTAHDGSDDQELQMRVPAAVPRLESEGSFSPGKRARAKKSRAPF